MEKETITGKTETERYEMRFAGSGGQGVILASVIMAEAAVLSGRYAIQSQSYGPEARGGACRGEAIISSRQIWFPKVTVPNVLLLLSEEAVRKYAADVTEDAVIFMEEHLEIPESLKNRRIIRIPIIETAEQILKKPVTANIIAVGAMNKALGLFDLKTMEEAVRRHVPAASFEINKEALEAGMKLAGA